MSIMDASGCQNNIVRNQLDAFGRPGALAKLSSRLETSRYDSVDFCDSGFRDDFVERVCQLSPEIQEFLVDLIKDTNRLSRIANIGKRKVSEPEKEKQALKKKDLTKTRHRISKDDEDFAAKRLPSNLSNANLKNLIIPVIGELKKRRAVSEDIIGSHQVKDYACSVRASQGLQNKQPSVYHTMEVRNDTAGPAGNSDNFVARIPTCTDCEYKVRLKEANAEIKYLHEKLSNTDETILELRKRCVHLTSLYQSLQKKLPISDQNEIGKDNQTSSNTLDTKTQRSVVDRNTLKPRNPDQCTQNENHGSETIQSSKGPESQIPKHISRINTEVCQDKKSIEAVGSTDKISSVPQSIVPTEERGKRDRKDGNLTENLYLKNTVLQYMTSLESERASIEIALVQAMHLTDEEIRWIHQRRNEKASIVSISPGWLPF